MGTTASGGSESVDPEDDVGMPAEESLPGWAEELRRRYLKGETSLFVLFGNVHDLVLHDKQLVTVADFLAQTVLGKKDTVIRYNLSTGCRFTKKAAGMESLGDLLVERAPDKVL